MAIDLMGLGVSVEVTGVKEGQRSLKEVADAAGMTEEAFQELQKTASSVGKNVAAAMRVASTGKGFNDLSGHIGQTTDRMYGFGTAVRASTSGLSQHARATNMTTLAWTNLGYQVNDVISGLAMGQAPLQILAQQGGQIYSSLSGGPGGVTGALKEVGSTVLGLITPVRALGVGFGATALAAVMLGRSAYNSNIEVERVVRGVGRASQATSSDIQNLSMDLSSSLNVSVGAAREAALVFASTGKVHRDQLGEAVTVAQDYAKVMGIDLAAAVETIAKRMMEPGQSAAVSAREFAGISEETVRLIQNLERSGKSSEAAALLLREIGREAAAAKGPVDGLADAWNKFWSNVSRGANVAGQGILKVVAPNQEQELANINRMLAETVRALEEANANGLREADPGYVADLEKEIKAYRDRKAEIEANIQKTKELQAAEAERAKAAEIERTGRQAVSQQVPGAFGGSGLESQAQSLAAYREQLKGLGQDTSLADEAIARVNVQLREMAAGGNVVGVELNRMQQNLDLNVQSMNAITLSQRMAAAGQAAYLEKLRETHSEVLAQKAAEDARIQTLAQSTAETKKSTHELLSQANALIAVSDAMQSGEVGSMGAADALAKETATRQKLIEAQKAQAEAQNNLEAARAQQGPGREAAIAAAERELQQANQAVKAVNALRIAYDAAAAAKMAFDSQHKATANFEYATSMGLITQQIVAGNIASGEANTLLQQQHDIRMRLAEIARMEERYSQAAKTATTPEELEALAALGRAIDEAKQSVDNLKKSYSELNEQQKKFSTEIKSSQLRVELETLRRLEGVVTNNAIERARLTAEIRAEQQLINQGISLNSRYAQTYVRLAGAVAAKSEQLRISQMLSQQTFANNLEVEFYRRATDALRMNTVEREGVMAALRAEMDLRRQGIDILTAEAQAYIASARAAGEAAAAYREASAAQSSGGGGGGGGGSPSGSTSGFTNTGMTITEASNPMYEYYQEKYGQGGSEFTSTGLRGSVRTGTNGTGKYVALWLEGFFTPTLQGLQYAAEKKFSAIQQEIEDSFNVAMSRFDAMEGVTTLYDKIQGYLDGISERPTMPDAPEKDGDMLRDPSAYGADKNANFFYDPNTRNAYLKQFGITGEDKAAMNEYELAMEQYKTELKAWEEAQEHTRQLENILAKADEMAKRGESTQAILQMMNNNLPAEIARSFKEALTASDYLSSQQAELESRYEQVMTETKAAIYGNYGLTSEGEMATGTGSGGVSFASAPRYGTLATSNTGSANDTDYFGNATFKVPKFAEGGEGVVTGRPGRDANRVMMDLTRGEKFKVTKKGSSGERPIQVIMPISGVRDPDSFFRSRSEIEGSLTSAIRRALMRE